MINGVQVGGEATLSTVLDSHGKKLEQAINCVKVGIIQSFNATKRTAKVQVVFIQQNWDGTTLNYPLLCDCPVVTLGGGNISAAFPIAAGDECLLLFADSNIDNWYGAGGAGVPYTARKHSISDAIALVGLNSLAKPLVTTLLATEGGISDGAAKIAVSGGGKITLANSTASFAVLMNTFLTACAGSTTDPVLASAATTLKTALVALLY